MKTLSWLKTIIGLLTGGIAIYVTVNIFINSDGNTVVVNPPPNPPVRRDAPTLDDTITVSKVVSTPDDVWETETIKVTIDGKEYEFQIAILSQEYRWKLGSHERVETGAFASIVPPYLSRLPRFQSALGFIALGAASEEGDRFTEIDRADRRADKIVEYLRPMINSRPLYKLNLGQYTITTGAKPPATAWQRRVIVVGIMKQDPELNESRFKRAVEMALSRSSGILFSPTTYSNFDFTMGL